MTPENGRTTRLVRGALLVGLFALAALLALVVHRHHGADARATAAAGDEDDAPRTGWRRWFSSSSRPAPPLPTWTLSGRVVDGSNRPVAGAAVLLARPARTTVSASDGGFRFDGLLAGAYDVEARQDERVGGPVRVHVGSDGKPVTLRLYRGARLEIEVVSIVDGHPIAGADVEVRVLHMHDGGGAQKGKTGADGKVRLAGAILIGSEARASAPGFAPAFKALDPSWQEGGVWHARIELVPGATFSGRVVDEAGFAIAGAVVEPTAVSRGPMARNMPTDSRLGNVNPLEATVRRQGVTTDAEGRFSVALSAGTWRLAATEPRHETAVGERLLSDGKTAHDGILLTMKNGVRLRGRVLAADGQPAPGAVVRARWQLTARVEREVRADGDGRFVLIGLPPALLSVQAEGEHATSLPQLLDLEAPPHEELALQLVNDGVITGTVVDEAGNPLPDVDVVYVEHSPSTVLTRVQPGVETTDDAGRFTIHGLSPSAVYALNAKRPQDGDAAFRMIGTDASPGQDVTLRIPGDGSVAGRVRRAGGAALDDVTVEVVDGGRPPQPVAADGRFRIDNLFARPYTLRVAAASAAFRDVSFTVSSGQVTDVGTIELPRARRVAGVVRRPDGQPAVGAGVTIAIAGDAQPVVTQVDGDGRFSALVPADAVLTLKANDRKLGETDPVSVGPSDAADAVELAFKPSGSVEGTLTRGGKPLPHVGVVAIGDAPAGGAAAVSGTQSDESGYFRIDGLRPGAYTVQLAAGDGIDDGAPQRVQVAAGDKAFANIELPAR